MRKYLFPPLILPLFILLVVFPFFLILFIFTGSSVFRVVFGVSYEDALLLFGMIIIGSLINIPIYERKGVEVYERFDPLGFIYSVRVRNRLIVAVNLGGCIFPSVLAIKALTDLMPAVTLMEWLVALSTSSIVIYTLAKPVRGVGITVPMLAPPLVAAVVCYFILALLGKPILLLPKFSFSIGVLSALIGADILHLKDLDKVGSGVVSIGGAGTFDGIFLTGLFAVVFSLFLMY